MTGLIPLCAVAIGSGRLADRLPEFSARVRDFLRVQAAVRRRGRALRRRRSGGDGRAGRARPAAAACSSGSATSRSSCRPTGCASVSAAYRGHPFEFWQDGQRGGHDRLRARRVDDRAVRRQLELARADLVPGQLPGDRGAGPLRGAARRLVHGRVPARLGQPADAHRDHHRSARSDWSTSSSPTATAAARCSATAERSRPELAGRAALPRVFPR